MTDWVGFGAAVLLSSPVAEASLGDDGTIRRKLQTQSDKLIDKAAAYRLLVAELALTVVVAGGLALGGGRVAAYSALCGGAAYIAPQFVFAHLAFRHSAAEAPRAALRCLYLGEAVKLALTAALFAAVIVLVEPLHFAALLLTFAGLALVNLCGLAVAGSPRSWRQEARE